MTTVQHGRVGEFCRFSRDISTRRYEHANDAFKAAQGRTGLRVTDDSSTAQARSCVLTPTGAHPHHAMADRPPYPPCVKTGTPEWTCFDVRGVFETPSGLGSGEISDFGFETQFWMRGSGDE